MIDGVLHQRLQGHLRNQAAVERGVGQKIIGENVLVADLLNLQIAPDVLNLLAQGDDILAVGEEGAEIGRETRDHLNGLVILPGFDQPDNRVQGVVEEMRVDLRLNQSQLHAAQPDLFLAVQLHLIIQTGDHLLQTGAERLKLAVLRRHGLAGGEIPFADFDHPLIQAVDRPGDAAADAEASAQRVDNDHDRDAQRKDQVHREPEILPGADGGQLSGLVVEIIVDIFLDQLRDDIDVGLQLVHPQVIAVRGLDLLNAAAQILTEIQNAVCGPVALPAVRVLQQCGRERLRRLDLFPGELLVAAGHKEVHLQIDFVLEVLVELGGGGDVPADLREGETGDQEDQQQKDGEQAQRNGQMQNQIPQSG